MQQPIFEVRGERPLRVLPHRPEAWMALGRTYVVILRRRSAHTFPEAEVRDTCTDALLTTCSWPHARQLFGPQAA